MCPFRLIKSSLIRELKRAVVLSCIPLLFIANTAQSNESLVVEKLKLGMTRAEIDQVFDHCSVWRNQPGVTQIVSCDAGVKNGINLALDEEADSLIGLIYWKEIGSRIKLDKIQQEIIEYYGDPMIVRKQVNDWRVCYGDCIEISDYDIDIAEDGKGMIVVVGIDFEKRRKLYIRLQNKSALKRLGVE